jgi:uncharacterized protein
VSYKHGVYISEVDTSVSAPVEVAAGLPVFVGCAPVNLADDPTAYVNKPLYASTYAEAVAALGYCTDYENYNLAEAIYVMFELYGVGPIIFINVLDPTKHKASVSDASVTIADSEVTIAKAGILLSSLVVKLTSAGEALTADTDYTAAFDDDGNVVVSVIDGGSISSSQTSLVVSYDYLDPSLVTSSDIIGGTDTSTGAATGMELIDQIFPLFGEVPGLLLAPGWSEKSSVAAVMKTKVQNINSLFTAMAICDIDSTSDGADLYTEVYSWKTTKNYTSQYQINCWPKVALDGTVYRLSTHLAGLICYTDSDNDDIPYVSPSNKTLQIDSVVTADGTEVNLGPDQAAYVNGKGVVTAVNIIGGWKAWGNNTGIYPSSTDPKDRWIPVRRMFNWIGNSIITTYWEKVDDPINKRLIQTVVDSMNIWLNSLTAKGALLGGEVKFNSDENATTDLLNGVLSFHVYITPPIPAEDMEFILEFDTSNLESLFDE